VTLAERRQTVNLEDYRKWTMTTLTPDLEFGSQRWREYVAMKLVGEVGEVHEKIGKWIRDEGGSLSKLTTAPLAVRLPIVHELGDVLWYYAQASLLPRWQPNWNVPDSYPGSLESRLGNLRDDVECIAYGLLTECYADARPYHVGAVASAIDFSLEEIATLNHAKIEDRKRRGKIGGSGDER